MFSTAVHNTNPSATQLQHAAVSNSLLGLKHKHKMVVVRCAEGDGREVQVLTSYYCLLPDGGVMLMP